jgi:hypothetical protein
LSVKLWPTLPFDFRVEMDQGTERWAVGRKVVHWVEAPVHVVDQSLERRRTETYRVPETHGFDRHPSAPSPYELPETDAGAHHAVSVRTVDAGLRVLTDGNTYDPDHTEVVVCSLGAFIRRFESTVFIHRTNE